MLSTNNGKKNSTLNSRDLGAVAWQKQVSDTATPMSYLPLDPLVTLYSRLSQPQHRPGLYPLTLEKRPPAVMTTNSYCPMDHCSILPLSLFFSL